MAKSTMISVRLDPELKANVEKVLKQMGIPLSVAIEIYLRQIVHTQSIPLSISVADIDSINKNLDSQNQRLERKAGVHNE